MPQANQVIPMINPNTQYVENDDGSVDLINPEEPQEESSFDENLVNTLDERMLASLATDLIELVERDEKTREKRDEQYAEGLRRTGLGEEKPKGATFQGASDVVHPVLAEACVDYSASMMKEIFPPDGPVKTKFRSSNPDPTQTERAENKRDFYNWQLTTQMPDYRSNLEVLSVQQPLGGSQFLKFWWDEGKNRPVSEFIPIDQIYLPYGATNFYTADRVTVVLKLTRMEFNRRIRAGLYKPPSRQDLDSISNPTIAPDLSAAEQVNEAIEGVTDEGFNEDGLRVLYEVYTYQDLENEQPLPYIITIDAYTQSIVAVYRNWEESDPQQQKLDWIVEFPFIPWRGAYGIGLGHLIGGLSAAATGALRALLDSAHINNFPGALRLKGSGRGAGQTITLNPTEIVEIEGASGVDDIRKLVMGLPYNAPSTVLFELLGFVVQAAKGVVAVAEEKIADAGNNMPVGTALALIEQGSKVFSSIHARQHLAQEKVLQVLNRLNAVNFDPATQERAFGRVLVSQEEFLNDNNIAPVSDPNIYSEAQRYAQIQGVLQLSADPTVQWNKVAIYRRLMTVMHIENPDEYLPPTPQPVSADPITEIIAAMTGQPLKVLPDMDHLVHINEQLNFLLDPIFGAANPVIMNPGFQQIFMDTQQHFVYLFGALKQSAQQAAMQQAQTMMAQMAGQLPPDQQEQGMQMLMSQPQLQEQVRLVADQLFEQQKASLAPLMEKFQNADQLVKQKTPPQPLPPEVQAQVQIAQLEVNRKTQLDQATLGLKQQEQQSKTQFDQIQLQLDERQQMFDNYMAEQEQRLSTLAEQLTQQVQLQKNRDDNRQHQMTELMKNHEDNQTNLMMEQMRQEGLKNRAEMEAQFRNQQQRMDKLIDTLMGKLELEQRKELEERKIEASKPEPKEES